MSGDSMLGFRSKTPWKIIIAIIYYGMCFAGFGLSVYKGIAVFILFASLPSVFISVVDAVRFNKKELLYSIPAGLLALAISIFFYTLDFDKQQKIAEPEITGTAIQSEIVFITRQGAKYHKQHCQTIDDKQTISITLEEAAIKNLTACKQCFD